MIGVGTRVRLAKGGIRYREPGAVGEVVAAAVPRPESRSTKIAYWVKFAGKYSDIHNFLFEEELEVIG